MKTFHECIVRKCEACGKNFSITNTRYEAKHHDICSPCFERGILWAARESLRQDASDIPAPTERPETYKVHGTA